MAYDVGDAVALSWTASASGGTRSVTVTLPDGTTTSPTVTTTAATSTATFTATLPGRHVVQWTATGALVEAWADVVDVVDGNDAGLVSVADLRRHLNITGSTYDDELRAFGMVAADLIEAHTGRTYRRMTIVDTFDAGTEGVILTRIPVLSLTSVVCRGVTVSANNYRLDYLTGRLRYKYGLFPGDFTDLVVTYTAGATEVPQIVQQAAKETVRHLWSTQRGSMGGRNPLSGDEYMTGMSFSLPRRVTELLNGVRVAGMA